MKIFFASLFILVSLFASAQIHALTETGDEVILYNDGTWAYISDSLNLPTEIPVNTTLFERDKKSTFLVKSKKVNVGVWLDPKKWSFTRETEEGAAEFKLERKGEDLYAMMITEKVEIALEDLKSIALQNARSAAPDISLINEEFRTVNGNQVLMMQMEGSIKGMHFTYFGYYFSAEGTTVQFLTYTVSDLFEQYYNDMEQLINGFVAIN